jgi:hypothetical protein
VIAAVHLLIALASVVTVGVILAISPNPNATVTALVVGPLQTLAHIVAQFALT